MTTPRFGSGRSRVPRPPGPSGGIGSERRGSDSVATDRPAPPKPPAPRSPRGIPSVNSPGRERSPLGSETRWVINRRASWRMLVAVLSMLLFVGGVVSVVIGRDSEENLPPGEVTPTSVQQVLDDLVNESPPSTMPIESGSMWERIARAVVLIDAQGPGCGWFGSGSIVGDGTYVLTNQHVSGDGECDLSIWLTDTTADAPVNYVRGEVVISDAERDLAVIRMYDPAGQPYFDPSRGPMKFSSSVPKLGDKITILGYPGLGGSTITLTSGDFSGVDKSENFDYFKTTANMNPGVSGGAALNSAGELVGVPTAGRGAEIACEDRSDCVANGSTIGLLRPVGLARELLNRAAN